MRVSKTDWAYLAALIEGEGHIALVKSNGGPSLQPRVVIAMSTEQPLKWVYETFGGCYSPNRKVRANGRIETRHRWGVYSKDWAQAILEGVLPYMKLKKTKAEEVIRYCESK